MRYSLFEIDGQIVRVSRAAKDGSRTLSVKDTSARLDVIAGDEISIRVEANQAKTVGLVIPFPLDAEFHVPEYRCTGRILDSDMPLGESYSSKAAYNFLLARIGGFFLRFMIAQPQLGRLTFEISRHPGAFLLTVTWPVEDSLDIALFSSIEQAKRSFEGYLKDRYQVRTLSDRSRLPGWINNVRLVFTIDMLRSNGDISHDYADLAGLSDALDRIGCPKDTLFYLPGWNGDYDSRYPTHRPHADLGGEEGFRAMMRRLHGNGHRVMIHASPGGVDPCHPDLARYMPMLRPRGEGSQYGWQTGPGEMPPARILKFLSGRIPFAQPKGARRFAVETIEVIDLCEAMLSVGCLATGSAGAQVTIGRRTQTIPALASQGAEAYAFPHAFLLAAGKNRMEVEILGEPGRESSEGWYSIDTCFHAPHPFSPWTYPILPADTDDPRWIETLVGELERAVLEYGIDAVHLDAATMDRPRDHRKLFGAIAERLPGIAIGGEWCSTVHDLGYWAFCQGATQSLVANTENARRTKDCNSIPVTSGLHEMYRWLDKPSDVCSFVADYFHTYQHLCATDAFVPVGKVCNVLPERLMPPDPEELWRVLRSTVRYGTLPNLRVNFRTYGLDENTRKAVIEIASRSASDAKVGGV